MYGLKHIDRVAFDQLIGQLQESRFRSERTAEQWERKLRNGVKRALKSVRSHLSTQDIVPESFLVKLEALLENTFQYQGKRVKPEEPLAVLCHGDFLRNNIAFKYSNIDEVMSPLP